MSATIRQVHRARTLKLVLGVAFVVLLLAVYASGAIAAEPTPQWGVQTIAPTHFVPGSDSDIELVVRNLGTVPGEAVTITDTLPAGLSFKSVAFYWHGFAGFDLNQLLPICPTPTMQTVTCSLPVSGFAPQITPGEYVKVLIEVAVAPSAPEEPVTNEALVEGDGSTAPSVTQERISSHPEFGISQFTLQTTEFNETHLPFRSGEPGLFEFANVPGLFTQAGGHPAALTTALEFSKEVQRVHAQGSEEELLIAPIGDPKDAVVQLPQGLLGNPMAVPRCPLAILEAAGGSAHNNVVPECPTDTIVGWARTATNGGFNEEVGPIVNMVPQPGESAEFALELPISAGEVIPLLTAHLVHTAQGTYGFAVISNDIPLAGKLQRVELTFWGVPADPSHDAMRGRECDKRGPSDVMGCRRGGVPGASEGPGVPAGVPAVPFLSMPTDCAAGPETAVARADSWEAPGSVREGRYSGFVEASAVLPAVTGCETLGFAPGIEVQPDTLAADSPVGLGVNVTVPQSEQPGSAVTPQLRDAVVTLPEGVSISPGIVDGIQACNESGPEGINFEGPESEEAGPSGELQLAPGKCPDASIVGTAEAITPLLPEPVKGHVYLARPKCGGVGESACTNQDALDGNLYQLYLELGGTGALANTGINIKAHGYVDANPATGQLTTKFLDNPQAPFSELKIQLNGGPRAPLDNPAVCGAATTSADFTPWSAPGVTPEGLAVPGTADGTPFSSFDVDLAGDGLATPCPALPFSPGFSAGTVSPQGGADSSFTLNLTRHDQEQYVKGIQVHTPPGLLGMLSSVPLCEEPLADNGHCPESSRIGSTRVASGAGSHPFEISGNVYLTKGYGGAPFGLSIVTDAVAGPFNLGLVVVRARIAVNQTDSSLTITTDETGPYAIPQIIFGVPLRLKQVTVNIDRPGFMFNPTSCNAQQITATVSGSGQTLANVATPFAAAGCRSLAFNPTFKVAVSGKTSRLGGASLDAKLTYPPYKPGSQANIAYVKVELPKQLPSRLTTLQKACPGAVFDSNPGNCPAPSIVGVAKSTTPLLPVPLEGPVYFVSHGGEAFPSLVVVLQGDGVRVDLTGSTFISKSGITSTTFKTVPDVPVSTFEIYLPEGPYSALAANANLCIAAAKLKVPTQFTAQNGATLKQNTKVTVTGCNKPKPKKKTKKAKRHASGAGRTHR